MASCRGSNLFSVRLDLAAQISGVQESLEEDSSNEVPTNLSLGAQISAAF